MCRTVGQDRTGYACPKAAEQAMIVRIKDTRAAGHAGGDPCCGVGGAAVGDAVERAEAGGGQGHISRDFANRCCNGHNAESVLSVFDLTRIHHSQTAEPPAETAHDLPWSAHRPGRARTAAPRFVAGIDAYAAAWVAALPSSGSRQLERAQASCDLPRTESVGLGGAAHKRLAKRPCRSRVGTAAARISQ
jgi:hypothetical protein